MRRSQRGQKKLISTGFVVSVAHRPLDAFVAQTMPSRVHKLPGGRLAVTGEKIRRTGRCSQAKRRSVTPAVDELAPVQRGGKGANNTPRGRAALLSKTAQLQFCWPKNRGENSMLSKLPPNGSLIFVSFYLKTIRFVAISKCCKHKIALPVSYEGYVEAKGHSSLVAPR